jgi:hypothetical protein
MLTFGFSRKQWMEWDGELSYEKVAYIIQAPTREQAMREYQEEIEEHDRKMLEVHKRKLGY